MVDKLDKFSLPCTCEVHVAEVLSGVQDDLNTFLAQNISETLICVLLRPYEEPRRSGSNGVWVIHLQDSVTAVTSKRETDMRRAARRIGGTLKGYDGNCCLITVQKKHLHKDL